jgi:hypothetical protein
MEWCSVKKKKHMDSFTFTLHVITQLSPFNPDLYLRISWQCVICNDEKPRSIGQMAKKIPYTDFKHQVNEGQEDQCS